MAELEFCIKPTIKDKTYRSMYGRKNNKTDLDAFK